MKSQWIIVCGLGLALLTAIAAVSNFEPVVLNYYWGEAKVSLIIVISASILVGGIIVAVFGTMRPYMLRKERDKWRGAHDRLSKENISLQRRLDEVESAYSLLMKEKRQLEAYPEIAASGLNRETREEAAGKVHG